MQKNVSSIRWDGEHFFLDVANDLHLGRRVERVTAFTQQQLQIVSDVASRNVDAGDGVRQSESCAPAAAEKVEHSVLKRGWGCGMNVTRRTARVCECDTYSSTNMYYCSQE